MLKMNHCITLLYLLYKYGIFKHILDKKIYIKYTKFI